ncbi:exodeoxyribonuclease III [bacterium]|nr:exodeoxyribonuclease III [bacterium]
MKIYSWNVNGIRAVENKGALEEFIVTHAPDVLCVQETKAQEEQVAAVFAKKYPQYKQYWHSAEKKGYSGTAIFTKIEPKQAFFGLPDDVKHRSHLDDKYGDTTNEGRVLTLEFDKFFVSTVYTPNAKEDLSRIPMRQAWDPAYLEYMKQLESRKPTIFCGDLNVAHREIDLARPKENKGKKGFTDEERAGLQAYIDNGFLDTLRVLEAGTPELYTWWSHWGKARERNVGWRIDYVFISTRLKSKLQSAKTHKAVLGSDHCPVSIEIKL